MYVCLRPNNNLVGWSGFRLGGVCTYFPVEAVFMRQTSRGICNFFEAATTRKGLRRAGRSTGDFLEVRKHVPVGDTGGREAGVVLFSWAR